MSLHEKMTRVRGDLWLVPGRRGARYPHCNSMLVDSGGKALIDPGSNKRVLREIAEGGVETVLLSHFHSDHLRDLKELKGARTMVHEIEKPAVESWEGMGPLVWFPEEERDPTWVKRKNREVGGWGWPVHETFKGGDEIIAGEVKIEVLHAPGHTPGHCCFWFPDERVLFAGDIDLTPFGPWYGNATSDPAAFIESIRMVKGLRPELIVTAHETGLVEGSADGLLDDYAAKIEQRHARILEYLSEPRTLEEVTGQGFIYGEHFGKSFRQPEWRMVRHHLEMALHRGETERLGDSYRLS